MPRGSKPGERRGGRQPGTPNKTTQLVNAAFAATTSNSGLLPLDFFLAVMRDPSIPPEWRFKAAKAAAPYVHAKPGGSPTTDSAASPKHIEGVCEEEARARDRILELAIADWDKRLTGAEAEELENLKKAYPPDPNNPLKSAIEAYERGCEGIEGPRAAQKPK
jgi:hypothetical protein